MAEALAVAIFAAWLTATLAAGVEESALARRVRSADPLRIVPGWSFFAPNPGTVDYHLLARTRTPAGAATEFAEIARPVSTFRRGVWHPEKRLRKAIFDCAHDINKLSEDERDSLEYTLPYLVLLNLVAGRADRGAAAVQFLLLRSSPELGHPELVLRSRFHPIAG